MAPKSSRSASEQVADEHVPVPAPVRRPRAATKKIVVDDDSDSEDLDAMLGDIGDMVKGIGRNTDVDDVTASSRVFNFNASHPGSTGPSGTASIKAKARPSRAVDLSEDETNYAMLAQSSPHKPMASHNDSLNDFLSDDDLPIVPAKKTATKPAPKPRKAPVTKKAAAAPAPAKPTPLSPAAKAYALKQSKLKVKPAAKTPVFSDDEDEDMAGDVLEASSPPPRAAAARRPARAAAVAATKKKPVYVDSDEDESMDDIENEDSRLEIEDESEGDDFDMSD